MEIAFIVLAVALAIGVWYLVAKVFKVKFFGKVSFVVYLAVALLIYKAGPFIDTLSLPAYQQDMIKTIGSAFTLLLIANAVTFWTRRKKKSVTK
jgi:hypothetical protein